MALVSFLTGISILAGWLLGLLNPFRLCALSMRAGSFGNRVAGSPTIAFGNPGRCSLKVLGLEIPLLRMDQEGPDS